MKKTILIAAALCTVATLKAQTSVKIGDMEFKLQSPISVNSNDSLKKNTFQYYTMKNNKKRYRNIEEFYVGVGFAVNTKEEAYLPVYYGNSYNLEFGWRYLYRPAKAFAIGTHFQYTSHTYRLKNAAANNTIVSNVPSEVFRENFRTDNIGTGLNTRFYLFPLNSRRPVHIDFGAYLDYAFSKRYKVKTMINGEKEKFKYRDGSKFSPFAAGLQGSITVKGVSIYTRYRLTDMFDNTQIPLEVPRWTLGVQFEL